MKLITFLFLSLVFMSSQIIAGPTVISADQIQAIAEKSEKISELSQSGQTIKAQREISGFEKYLKQVFVNGQSYEFPPFCTLIDGLGTLPYYRMNCVFPFKGNENFQFSFSFEGNISSQNLEKFQGIVAKDMFFPIGLTVKVKLISGMNRKTWLWVDQNSIQINIGADIVKITPLQDSQTSEVKPQERE